MASAPACTTTGVMSAIVWNGLAGTMIDMVQPQNDVP